MALGNLRACLEHVWPFEGGYVDHPKDPGGATNMGITHITLAEHRRRPVTKTDVRNLTKAEAAEIYDLRYWRPLSGDKLRVGVDLTVLDFGINSGISRSAKYTQAIAGVTQDGKIGPVTLRALEKIPSRDVIKRLCARRLSFIQSLKIWNTFGKGWSRRIASVEATALGWVSSKAQLDQDAKSANQKATGQGGAAVGTGGSAVAVDQTTNLPLSVVVAIAVLIGGALLVRAVVNGQRAKALREAASKK
jgi:lysozyme family protein